LGFFDRRWVFFRVFGGGEEGGVLEEVSLGVFFLTEDAKETKNKGIY